MKPRHSTHETRSARSRRQLIVKGLIWAFLIVFLFSILGVAVIVVK